MMSYRVEVQERVDVQSTTGQPVPTYRTVGTRWASLESMEGVEITETGIARVIYKAVLRYDPDRPITPRHRLRHVNPRTNTERVFNVEAVLGIETRSGFVELKCVEKV
jgi:head-tail adaptor